MSEDQPVTRREFDAFRELAKERREADSKEHARLGHEIERVGKTQADDMDRLAEQREKDLAEARRRGEWSWQTKLVVAGLAIALAGLWVQALAAHK